MNSFDCTAHSQLCAGKNIGGSPELHLTDSSRLLWGRVKCHHKSSTQVTHRRVGDNANSSAQEDAHETYPLLGTVTLGGLRAVIHAIVELSSAFQVATRQKSRTERRLNRRRRHTQANRNRKRKVEHYFSSVAFCFQSDHIIHTHSTVICPIVSSFSHQDTFCHPRSVERCKYGSSLSCSHTGSDY